MNSENLAVRGMLIVGLRRSGTTVFWNTFRKDISTCCFDEPFHPALWEGQILNSKGTWTELAKVWQKSGSIPVDGVMPIFPNEELSPLISPQQAQYFRLLFEQNTKVVVDAVRIWNKLPALTNGIPNLQVIHLVRSPISWVTAHLIPPDVVSWRRQVKNVYRRTSFFRRQGGYNNWHYQEIVEEALRSNHPIWRFSNLKVPELMQQPAYVKLLAFWWAVTKHTHKSLQKINGSRHMTTTLEDFSRNPKDIMDRVYAQAGWFEFGEDLSHVRSVRPGWRNQSEKWADVFSLLGIPLDFRFPESFNYEVLVDELSK